VDYAEHASRWENETANALHRLIDHASGVSGNRCLEEVLDVTANRLEKIVADEATKGATSAPGVEKRDAERRQR
jgi:Holliday junction resolvasome RuvABC DNA-binding subunit